MLNKGINVFKERSIIELDTLHAISIKLGYLKTPPKDRGSINELKKKQLEPNNIVNQLRLISDLTEQLHYLIDDLHHKKYSLSNEIYKAL